jgi:hypothetical protein
MDHFYSDFAKFIGGGGWGVQVCSNERKLPSPRTDNSKKDIVRFCF